MAKLRRVLLPLLASALALAPAAEAEVTFDWAIVGDPGNADDPVLGLGAVADSFAMAKHEVTNAPYAEFLNAVATTDTYILYSLSMGIDRSGSSGSFSYSATAGLDSRPVAFLGFYTALPFVNWLHNGQPTGAQDASTTEDGAYTITAQCISENSILRNSAAAFFIPSRDEWFKAAYYDALSMTYFQYPFGTGTQTVYSAPGSTANTANCGNVVGTATDVGSYSGALSPYGTFVLGGNLEEYNDTVLSGNFRGLRGGTYTSGAINLRRTGEGLVLATTNTTNGFAGIRVAALEAVGLDSDVDGIADFFDNCPFVVNPVQANQDGFAAGDACQCGDVDGDGDADAADLELARSVLLGVDLGAVTPVLTACNLSGGPPDCRLEDTTLIDRMLGGGALDPNACDLYARP